MPLAPIRGGNIKPQHVPFSLSSFGTNPRGEAMWRVVWAKSRLHLVGGRWGGTTDEYRWVPRYGSLEAWVLEKWLSPEKFAGSPERWERDMKDPDSGLYFLGPYPSEGEYEHCFTFPAEWGTPAKGAIERVIDYIRASERYSLAEKRKALQDEADRRARAKDSQIEEVVHDALSGVLTARVSAGNPGKRTKNDIQFRTTAPQSKRGPQVLLTDSEEN